MKYLFFSVNYLQVQIHLLVNACYILAYQPNKIYLIRILRDYLLRANTDFLKIIMIFTFISFMITDKMGKTMTFSGWLLSEFCTQTLKAALIVFWCFHQPITVLAWWQPKHTFVISFFSSGFFHSIRHVHKYP